MFEQIWSILVAIPWGGIAGWIGTVFYYGWCTFLAVLVMISAFWLLSWIVAAPLAYAHGRNYFDTAHYWRQDQDGLTLFFGVLLGLLFYAWGREILLGILTYGYRLVVWLPF